jgi:hypothetical protein
MIGNRGRDSPIAWDGFIGSAALERRRSQVFAMELLVLSISFRPKVSWSKPRLSDPRDRALTMW